MKSSGSVGFSSVASPVVPATNPRQAAGKAPATVAAPDATSHAVALSWDGPNQAKIGDRISLTLNNSAPLGAKSLGFQVGYDPAVLKAVDVIEGDAMKQNNASSNLIKTINQKSGTIVVGLSGSGTGEASGGGSVVTLVFEVTGASPSSQIAVRNITSAATGGGSLALAAPQPHVLTVAQ
jgi:general secretion pathway protein D